MKKFNIETAHEIIRRQKEYFRSQALEITNEDGLEIAYRIMSTKPSIYNNCVQVFKEQCLLLTALRVKQILNVLDITETEDNIHNIESIIKYTQLAYAEKVLHVQGKEQQVFAKDGETVEVYTDEYNNLEKLCPVCEDRYYIAPLFLSVKTDDEEIMTTKIIPETYCFYGIIECKDVDNRFEPHISILLI